MAKLNEKYDFKNVEVSYDEGLIHEFDKDGALVATYSLGEILDKIQSLGRIDLSINIVTVPTTIEGFTDTTLNSEFPNEE